MSSNRFAPLTCPKCTRTYAISNRMVTLSCGHSQCAKCTTTLTCATCLAQTKLVPAVDVSTFVCAGCNRHYINHYDVVINQVRILKCGHRRMCNHTGDTCAVCSTKATELAIDVSLTALVCRVCITDPEIPRVKRRRKGRCPCAGMFSRKQKIYDTI